MDFITFLIIVLAIVLIFCQKQGFNRVKTTKEDFYNGNLLKKEGFRNNFYNFKTINRPPMPSPYQCTLEFGCTQNQHPSDTHESVCMNCSGINYPKNLVMARDVGRVRQLRKLY